MNMMPIRLRGRRSIRIMRNRFILAVLATGLLASLPARAEHEWFKSEPPLLALSGGASQVCDSDMHFFCSLEYRPAFRFHHVGPWISVGGGGAGELFSALGLLLDVHLGRDWFLTGSFGSGYFEDGDGTLDLGCTIEFRSGVELSKRFQNGHRLGAGFSHLSNGPLSRHNPGTEMLYLLYAVPLNVLFHRHGMHHGGS